MLEKNSKQNIEVPKETLEMMDKDEATSKSETYNDEEIKEPLQQVFEEIPEPEDKEIISKTESEDENIETSSDTYSLMRKRIEEMKFERATIVSENDRKRRLIEEYKELTSELEKLILKGLELDNTINSLLGIESLHEVEETNLSQELMTVGGIETARELLSEEISKKREENQRKQKLIDEFRKIEAQLNIVQNESYELDLQIASMFSLNNSHIKKRGVL